MFRATMPEPVVYEHCHLDILVHIRRAAVDARIPCFTSLDTARAAAESLANGDGGYSIKPLSQYLSGT